MEHGLRNTDCQLHSSAIHTSSASARLAERLFVTGSLGSSSYAFIHTTNATEHKLFKFQSIFAAVLAAPATETLASTVGI